jgi:hypothetical protein
MPVNAAALRNNPKIKFAQQRFNLTVDLALEKTALHLQNPQQFPLPPANTKSLERALYNLIQELPGRKRDKFADRMKAALSRTPAQRQQKYGDLSAISLSNTIPVAEQVKGIAIAENMKISEVELSGMLDTFFPDRKLPGRQKAAKDIRKPRVANFATKLDFVVDTLVCNETNDIRKDEISIGAFGVDATGATSSIAPFFVGKFKKGESVSPGEKGNLFSFTIGDGQGGGLFPETFTAGFFLVEGDLIHNQELSDKLALVLAILGETLLAIGFVMLYVPALGPTFFFIIGGIGLGLGILGHFVIPIITDDFAEPVTDSFLLNELPRPGEFVSRSFESSINTSTGFTKGNYTVNIKWVTR